MSTTSPHNFKNRPVTGWLGTQTDNKHTGNAKKPDIPKLQFARHLRPQRPIPSLDQGEDSGELERKATTTNAPATNLAPPQKIVKASPPWVSTIQPSRGILMSSAKAKGNSSIQTSSPWSKYCGVMQVHRGGQALIISTTLDEEDQELVAVKNIGKRSTVECKTIADVLKMSNSRVEGIHRAFEYGNEIHIVTTFTRHILAEIIIVSKPLAETQIRYIAESILSAIGFLWKSQLYHADVSTSSIMLSRKGNIILGNPEKIVKTSHQSRLLVDFKGLGIVLWDAMNGEKTFDSELPISEKAILVQQSLSSHIDSLNGWSSDLLGFLDQLLSRQGSRTDCLKDIPSFLSGKIETLRTQVELASLQCCTLWNPINDLIS